MAVSRARSTVAIGHVDIEVGRWNVLTRHEAQVPGRVPGLKAGRCDLLLLCFSL